MLYNCVMVYEKIVKAKFLCRPNRFVAKVLIKNEAESGSFENNSGNLAEETVHVKNTGRCRELLQSGVTVYLEDFINSPQFARRKYRYSLVAVEKQNALASGKTILVNMDSLAPNKVVNEALKSGSLILPGLKSLVKIVPECQHKDSRFDFFVEDEAGQKAFIEVKGVTLENNGHATFPDAPTLRGIKHLNGLKESLNEGYKAYAIFVVQMHGISDFAPDYIIHPDFAAALKQAKNAGVEVLCYGCTVTPDTMQLNIEDRIPVLV